MLPQHWTGRTIALLLAFSPASAWAHIQESRDSPPTGDAPAAGRAGAEPAEAAADRMSREGGPASRPADREAASPATAPPPWHSLAPVADHPAAMHPYYKMHVTGAGLSEFYYLRQDLFVDLAGTDPLRIQAVAQGKTFGPFPVGSVVKVRAGDNYVLLPVCAGQINGIARQGINLAYGQVQAEVTLSCQH